MPFSGAQKVNRMRTLLFVLSLILLIVWVVVLQRRLEAAQMRGDMYREIAARLDRQLVQNRQEPPR